MPRIARVVAVGQAHHVTQRGNKQQDVFLQPGDREMYLGLLREYTKRYQLSLIGYCLMTNHIHLVVVPESRQSLAKAIGRTHNDYSRWLNVRQHEVGHLWQNRFFSCPLSERHTWAALQYVEMNPVRAGLSAHAWDWPWSSARAHIGAGGGSDWIDHKLWLRSWDNESWRVALDEGLGEADILLRLRSATLTGLPLGDETFLSTLEAQAGRSLRPQKRGPRLKVALQAAVPE